jgi:Xaa-Pro aminopeptidase
MADNTAPAPRATANRSTVPVSDAFKDFISAQWAERTESTPQPREQSAYAAVRRARVSALYAGKRLIVPAGAAKVRSNDTDYAYRPHSAFSHLTGWATDSVPGSVLVLEPTTNGHEATLYFRKAAGRDSDEFYADSDIGEFWTGPRPSLVHVAHDLGLNTADLAEFAAVLDTVDSDTILLRDADRDLTDQIDGRRLLAADTESVENDTDDAFARDLSELRLVKDAYEIAQMHLAVTATRKGFDDVIADRDAIIAHERGERLVEGTFNRRARAR